MLSRCDVCTIKHCYESECDFLKEKGYPSKTIKYTNKDGSFLVELKPNGQIAKSAFTWCKDKSCKNCIHSQDCLTAYKWYLIKLIRVIPEIKIEFPLIVRDFAIKDIEDLWDILKEEE